MFGRGLYRFFYCCKGNYHFWDKFEHGSYISVRFSGVVVFSEAVLQGEDLNLVLFSNIVCLERGGGTIDYSCR